MTYPGLLHGDCLILLKSFEKESADLIYIDPPFFTQKVHALTTKDGLSRYSFRDIWPSIDEYRDFLQQLSTECARILKNTGSLFFHCDHNAGHIARLMLDEAFGSHNFQSEIVWTYKRWTNSRKGLIPSHQKILFYSKSDIFKFNTLITPYSETTNIDQILQRRIRDHRGKAVYAKSNDGKIINNGGKKGVPLGDVWEIPYLNPKAKERVSYPTQKPLLLLERIIQLCTDPEDLVMDPFCGSGTTMVAAQSLNRRWVGIDISKEALAVTQSRLENPIRSRSNVFEAGRESYVRNDLHLLDCLKGLGYHPVHRNAGIDAILTEAVDGNPVFIRIQRPGETVDEAGKALAKASTNKGEARQILVIIEDQWGLLGTTSLPLGITLVNSTVASIRKALMQTECTNTKSSIISDGAF